MPGSPWGDQPIPLPHSSVTLQQLRYSSAVLHSVSASRLADCNLANMKEGYTRSHCCTGSRRLDWSAPQYILDLHSRWNALLGDRSTEIAL